MDRSKIIKMTAALAIICAAVGMLARITRQNQESLIDYAESNPQIAYSLSENTSKEKAASVQDNGTSTNPSATENKIDLRSNLTGALLNSSLPEEEYTLYSEGFYYAPISDNLQKYLSGASYPKEVSPSKKVADFENLRYVHIWHFDLAGTPVEGELVCNKAIADDLVEIFCELYRNKYRIESVKLLEEFDSDLEKSISSNNSLCFYYSESETDDAAASHSYGLAVDVNPVYNPSIRYGEDGEIIVIPENAAAYADRAREFPYKIDETDLCYRLFTEHGFIWGGNSNSSKNYQHFEASYQP